MDEDVRIVRACPECDEVTDRAAALGWRNYFRCQACDWSWSELDRDRQRAAFEDYCDQARKHRREEGS